jgi:phosphonopyruvate decarboxylase
VLACSDFYELLGEVNIRSFAGVPDSLLRNFCAYVTDHAPAKTHCITANEGAAVALAAGRYLAGGGIGLVYLQNSGLGNIINPICSLADSDVYSIPMLLLIGWRGEPGVKDEPQHITQGRNMLAVLDAIGVPYGILPPDRDGAKQLLARASSYMAEHLSPFAIVVRKDTFGPYDLKSATRNPYRLTREHAIELILENLEKRAAVISTTGMISREVFELRSHRGSGHERDFLTVGSMGHACQLALGVALEQPSRPVYCLDGDGALLMHMGSAAVLASLGPKNLTHIILNNGAHDSVGGQPTVGFQIDVQRFAAAAGYQHVGGASEAEEIPPLMQRFAALEGPKLLELRVALGARSGLGRPTTTPQQNKFDFIRYLRS